MPGGHATTTSLSGLPHSEISDPSDPRLTDYVSLTDVVLRRRHEPERGLYIAESQKVIRRALRAGHRPRADLMARRWLDDLSDIVADAEADGIPVDFGDHDVIEQLTGFHLHRGALAAMQRPALPTVESLIADARRVIVLEDVVDHTERRGDFRSAGCPRRRCRPHHAPVRRPAVPSAPSGCRWGRCSRCPGPGSTPGRRASDCCTTPG